MNSTYDITVNSAGQLVVSGELNFTTVPELNLRGCQLISASPMPIFDFKLVTMSDNAGLALLISWLRYAKRLHKPIKFINVPKQLLAIAQVSGLEQVILDTNNNGKKGGSSNHG